MGGKMNYTKGKWAIQKHEEAVKRSNAKRAKRALKRRR